MFASFQTLSLVLLTCCGHVAHVQAAPSFRNEVMAAVSKAGCNLGTCHGNATGKGSFKLSLRGYDIDILPISGVMQSAIYWQLVGLAK